jgi:hypothetical protein
MKVAFTEINFRDESLRRIAQINTIVDEYMEQGLKLTLRQLYYQFVARGYIPNNVKEYGKLQDLLTNARMCGEVDWDSIEDRTRDLEKLPRWNSPHDILSSCVYGFRIDKWEGQKFRPEVWIEKDALTGVIQPTCNNLDIPYLSCRGYTSASTLFDMAYRRFAPILAGGQIPLVIHFGDHDPSGLDMTRDITERIQMMSAHGHSRNRVKVIRVALNMDQVDAYNPPPNPAKSTDSRYKEYEDKYGKESWELDALPPGEIQRIIRDTVLQHRDESLWSEAREVEESLRDELKLLQALSSCGKEDSDRDAIHTLAEAILPHLNEAEWGDQNFRESSDEACTTIAESEAGEILKRLADPSLLDRLGIER